MCHRHMSAVYIGCKMGKMDAFTEVVLVVKGQRYLSTGYDVGRAACYSRR